MYVWRINMINGRYYYVESEYNSYVDFATRLLGADNSANKTVMDYKLSGEDNAYVAIISDKVCSIEWTTR